MAMRGERRLASGCLLLVACLCLTGVASGMDLYVSCDGSVETGDGSEANPFVFISSAVEAMSGEETEYVVNIQQGAECTGPENSLDMHIPDTVSSVSFTSDSSDKPTIVCGSDVDAGVMFHYANMGVFSWEDIDVHGCGTLLHGTGGRRDDSFVSLWDSSVSEATDDILRLTDVEQVLIQHCTFGDIDGAVVLAHALESGPRAYVVLFSNSVFNSGGVYVNGYRNVTSSNNEFNNVVAPFSITADGGEWAFWATSFTNCSSLYGGAINAVGTHGNSTASTLSILMCNFISCNANRGGGVYMNGGALSMIDSNFIGCSAQYGAGMAVGAVHGEVSLTCKDNEAAQLGGCLYLSEASTISFKDESSVTENTAGVAGAAFACSGPDNELITDDADSIFLADNKPKSFVNACVVDYYDDDGSSHWLVLAAAILGVLIVGAVLAAFICFEVYKYIKARRVEEPDLEGEEMSDLGDGDSEGVAVEYDFSQPAAVVADSSTD